MAAPISFLHRVVHAEHVIADNFSQASAGLTPPFETTPHIIVNARGTGTGYDDLWAAAELSGPSFYQVGRRGNDDDLAVRVQAIEWNVGVQP